MRDVCTNFTVQYLYIQDQIFLDGFFVIDDEWSFSNCVVLMCQLLLFLFIFWLFFFSPGTIVMLIGALAMLIIVQGTCPAES